MGKTIKPVTEQLHTVLTEDSLLLFCHTTNEVEVSLYSDDKTYVVIWNDHVVNEWAEEYSTLGIALARIALLVQGAEAEQFFIQTPDNFDAAWAEASKAFLEGHR